MRLLIVNSERGVAGGLSSSIDLAEGLARRGHDVTAACHPTSRLRSVFEAGDLVRVLPLAIRAELNLWRSVQLAAALRRIRPDVVIADRRKDLKFSWSARLLAPGARLVHRHGAPSSLRDSALYRAIWTRIDAMVVNSIAMRERLLKETPWIRAVPIHVVHNGKDLDRYHPAPESKAAVRRSLGIDEEAFVVCYHGVLEPRKNVNVLLDAIARLDGEPAPHALIIGGGACEVATREHATGLGIRATFTGVRLDVPDLLAAADVAVHLSSSEGFSNSVIEAMSSGLPVIASRATSHGEQIEDGASGFLVDAENVTDVAAAIDRFRVDPRLARRMGDAARERAEAEFGIERMIDAWERVLSSLSSPEAVRS